MHLALFPLNQDAAASLGCCSGANTASPSSNVPAQVAGGGSSGNEQLWGLKAGWSNAAAGATNQEETGLLPRSI